MAASPNKNSDGTVGKALEVLDQVANFGRPVRFTEILEQSTHPKATLYRLIQTLTNSGMLSYDQSAQTYSLGLRLVRLAHSAWRQSSIAPIARPYLDALSEKVGETIHLAQLDRGQVLYVDKRNAVRPIEMFSQAGKIGPGYCTGVGKAIMAYLPTAEQDDALQRQAYFKHTEHTLTTPDALRADFETIRAQGVAYDREEHEEGIVCIAAPIILSTGKVIGALSITTSTQRNTLDGLGAFQNDLIHTATQIASAAESWQFPS